VQALAQEMEWIARILSGERDLFHELIRPYERAVFLTAVSVLRDTAEAEDAAQEAMIKAYRGLGSFRGDAKFSTWLTTITLNEARSRLRKSAKGSHRTTFVILFALLVELGLCNQTTEAAESCQGLLHIIANFFIKSFGAEFDDLLRRC